MEDLKSLGENISVFLMIKITISAGCTECNKEFTIYDASGSTIYAQQ